MLYNKTFAVHAAAAAASVALGTAVTYPLDTLKVLIQVSNLRNGIRTCCSPRNPWTISFVIHTSYLRGELLSGRRHC